MYNGIGLQTARGTGTNGYVQRNLSFVRTIKEKVEYKPDEEIKKLEAYANRKGNAELLKHERKRKIELKCVEMEDLMREQGYSDEEIDRKVEKFRKQLIDKDSHKEETQVDFEFDEYGRPIATESHKLAEANDLKNKKLREAFGLGEFDPEVRAKQMQEERKVREAQEAEIRNKRYQWVDEDDIDDYFDKDYDAHIKSRRMASQVIEVNKAPTEPVEIKEPQQVEKTKEEKKKSDKKTQVQG